METVIVGKPETKTKIAFLSRGQRLHLPCLVMHGGLGYDHTYMLGLNMLDGFLDLTYYDHRHNGRSGRPMLSTVTHAQLVEDAEELRQRLNRGAVTVLGHDYGGFVALEYALRYPESVSHLILVSTAPSGEYRQGIVERARAKGASLEMIKALTSLPLHNKEMRAAIELTLPLYFHQYKPQYYDNHFSGMLVSAPVRRHQERLLDEYDVRKRLGAIRCPTLIIVGRHDIFTPPEQSKMMADSIPGSRLVIFEESGHYPWIEERALFAKTVREWWTQTHFVVDCKINGDVEDICQALEAYAKNRGINVSRIVAGGKAVTYQVGPNMTWMFSALPRGSCEWTARREYAADGWPEARVEDQKSRCEDFSAYLRDRGWKITEPQRPQNAVSERSGRPGRPLLSEDELIYRLAKAQEAEEIKARNPEMSRKEIAKLIDWRYGWRDSGVALLKDALVRLKRATPELLAKVRAYREGAQREGKEGKERN